jgi:hypothetical protein
MSARFQELDWQDTPLGPISLRRRREPALDVDVYEVKLGDEFLMSSLFTAAEVQLARLGLAPFATGARSRRRRRPRGRARTRLHTARPPSRTLGSGR